MLTASGPFVRSGTSATPGELVVAGGVGILLFSMIYSTVYIAQWSRLMETPGSAVISSGRGFNPADEGNTARPIGMKLIGVSVEDIGSPHPKLSTGYLLPFEIVSIHLLVVLIGAAYLARAKRRVTPPTHRAGVAMPLNTGGNGAPPESGHETTKSIKVPAGASAHEV
jgi:NADH-quinone oxidoreductase subunit J